MHSACLGKSQGLTHPQCNEKPLSWVTAFVITASLVPGKGGRGFYGECWFMGWKRTFSTLRGWTLVHTGIDAQQGVDQVLGGVMGVVGDRWTHQAVFGSTGRELFL